MTIARLAVCSWSLRPTGPADLAAGCCRAGVRAVQLALDPLRLGQWRVDDTLRALDEHRVEIVSGMMGTYGEDYSTLESIERTGGLRPDEHFERNLAAAHENARLAAELGLSLVTLHAGHLPKERDDPARAVMIERLGRVADAFAAVGVRLGLETGQESSDGLLALLDDLRRSDVGVNFDPANMVLYGTGDPIPALERLAPRVFQVHVKDALWAERPGTWGTEVAAGLGVVPWERFFEIVAAHPEPIDVVIERESGENRVGDVARARELVARFTAHVAR